MIIENSQFTKNSAKEGGAVKVTSDSHIYIENSTFKENSATSNGGGAIYSNKWLHIGNSVFEKNTANGKVEQSKLITYSFLEKYIHK